MIAPNGTQGHQGYRDLQRSCFRALMFLIRGLVVAAVSVTLVVGVVAAIKAKRDSEEFAAIFGKLPPTAAGHPANDDQFENPEE